MDRIGSLSEEKQRYLEEINKYFCGNRMGYIKVPTGWGKTFLAKHLMKQYREEGKTVLFLVSRNNQLLAQTSFGNDGQRLFPNSIILSSDHDKVNIDNLQDKIKNRDSGSIILASLQTILSKNNIETKDILSQNSDLVIIDEVHNFIDNRGDDFINNLNQNAKIFGMTATPFQGVIGNVKFVDDISKEMREIFSKTLPQCIMEGQLCELNYKIIYSNQIF
ncbi:hypothetical protein AUJ95_04090 [Candidatus Desantisbacteria bacterium CG2_30_40_21]|nr:MAG: hypothetical protein AUJ95_04090 [Candidatus Desantisbacteria bacterium CG2_30_40_21]